MTKNEREKFWESKSGEECKDEEEIERYEGERKLECSRGGDTNRGY